MFFLCIIVYAVCAEKRKQNILTCIFGKLSITVLLVSVLIRLIEAVVHCVESLLISYVTIFCYSDDLKTCRCAV